MIERANLYADDGNEEALVLHMTPYLAALFPSLDLVNSERLNWLEMMDALDHHRTKPDLFWCHSVCWMNGNDARAASDDRYFGTIPSRSLYADVVLADCKVAMTHQAIGELMIHLHQLSCVTKQPARGIVFARHKCHAMEIGENGSITRHAELFLDQVHAAVAPIQLCFQRITFFLQCLTRSLVARLNSGCVNV